MMEWEKKVAGLEVLSVRIFKRLAAVKLIWTTVNLIGPKVKMIAKIFTSFRWIELELT